MVRTISRSPRTALAAVGFGVTLAGVAGLTLVVSSPANADATTSTAYGVAATGTDPVAATPSVSSADVVKTASGSAAGKAGTFSASGITVKAGAGIAEAAVANLTVAGKALGSVTAKCANGETTYSHTGSAPDSPNLKVSWGGSAGATITLVAAGGKAAETITVAVVKCSTGTPPTTVPPTTVPPTSKPTMTPTGQPTSPTEVPTATSAPGATPLPGQIGDAPAPTPVDGHHPVTG